jgi:CheY-like chemotaxis protein
MNTALMSPAKPTPSTGRLLVIEPDASRAIALREILRQCDDIEFEIVKSVPDALRRLGERIPDVVLTSTFLPPADEVPLTAHLNQTPAAAHVQLITLPYFIDSEDRSTSENPSGRLVSFLRRREGLARPRCDVRTLRQQIEEYLSKARAIQLDQSSRAICVFRATSTQSPEMHLTRVTASPSASRALVPENGLVHPRAIPGMPADRRRARRHRAGELPWLCDVKLPGIPRASLIDISSGGVLLETTSRILQGSTIELELLGRDDTNRCVLARIVRNQVAAVDGLAVSYHVAAAFSREIDLHGPQAPSTSSLTPKALAHVLTRVLSEVDDDRGAPGLRARFEQEVRRLLSVRDIQIRHSPMLSGQGAESIYFTVPSGSGSQSVLQATFERNHAPTAMELHLLKAAATMAAVILEFAPLNEPNHQSSFANP